MTGRDPSREVELLSSQLAAFEELLAEQERTVAEQSARIVATREKALDATRAKSEFMARMSHELRTPLNSVIGFANILLKNKPGNLLDKDITYLERVRENGVHLLDLINSILDLSKVEAGKMELHNEEVAVCRLILETVDQLEGDVVSDAVKLIADCSEGSLPLVTDAGKLKQVIINLIGNALKFTERGNVTVKLHVDPRTRRPLRIEVIDTGIGISPEKLGSVFDAFEQIDGSSARRHAGTGLGLSICKSFCDLMGHRLEVESQQGVGSVFRVLLDYDDAAESRREQSLVSARQPPAAVQSVEGLTVLVIDDESDSRMLLKYQLEELGAAVITAGSGEEGLRVARERRPDLITLDIMMPGMDGWQVLQRLKASPEASDIPVVIVTISGEAQNGTLLGALDCLPKPVTRGSLSGVLNRIRHKPAGAALIVEDDPDSRMLLSQLLEDEGLEVRWASNGAAALMLLESFAPDFIVVDLMMPVMDGVSFIQTLRRSPTQLHIPVVVVSAREPTPDESQMLQGNTQAVLQKGRKIEDDLKEVIREFFRPIDPEKTA